MFPRSLTGAALLLACTACAVPEAVPPTSPAAVNELRQRTAPETVQAALDLLHANQLVIAVPMMPADSNPATLDADASDWWIAMAAAFGPEVRAARAELQRAKARASGMGAPMPIGTETEAMSLDGNPEVQLKLMVDLLGLIGVGRSAAENELGAVEVRAARGRLAEALWRSRFSAERARITLAARRALRAEIDALVTQAEADQSRILQLRIHGRLAENDVATARTLWHRLLEMRLDATGEIAEAEAALAVACGLAPDAAPLARVSLASIEDFDVPGGVPKLLPPEDALSARPDLHNAALEFALAEAELRLAASQAIPQILPGYMPLYASGMKPSQGAMMKLDLNWPTAVQSGVDAALARRDAAAEAYTDAVLAAWTQQRSAHATMMAAYENYNVHAPIVDNATTTSWNAARRSFALDRALLTSWTMELERRMDGLAMIARHREHGLNGILDYLEALGPAGDAR